MTTDLAPAAAPEPLAAAPARPRTFSGIQPSGIVHLGNDLGAIRNYVKLQFEYEAIYCIVDYHALTSTHDADVLRTRTREMAAGLLALGLDPERCTLFVQSHRPEHTELAWLLMTVTPVSWLERTPTATSPKAAPSAGWSSSRRSSSARMTSEPTVPAPSTPTRSRAPLMTGDGRVATSVRMVADASRPNGTASGDRPPSTTRYTREP